MQTQQRCRPAWASEWSMRGSRGGQGVRTPLKNHKNRHKNNGFLSNTGPDPLKNHKASMKGRHRHASETPFKWEFCWRVDDGPFIVVFGSSLPSSTKTNNNKSFLSWTPSDKTFWIRACGLIRAFVVRSLESMMTELATCKMLIF